MSISLESLGVTNEELIERVSNKIVEMTLAVYHTDPEDGSTYQQSSPFSRQLQEAAKKKVDEAIAKIADSVMLPNITALIEAATLQKTNEWGEKKGVPMTFTEYLTQQAESYLMQKVDYEGKPAGQYGKDVQTRITHIVHRHLHYTIEHSMKEATKDIAGILSAGIQETCKIKLAELSNSIKVVAAVNK